MPMNLTTQAITIKIQQQILYFLISQTILTCIDVNVHFMYDLDHMHNDHIAHIGRYSDQVSQCIMHNKRRQRTGYFAME